MYQGKIEQGYLFVRIDKEECREAGYRMWPVGQVVKTAASHAANGSSTLPRVTKNKKVLDRVLFCDIISKYWNN